MRPSSVARRQSRARSIEPASRGNQLPETAALKDRPPLLMPPWSFAVEQRISRAALSVAVSGQRSEALLHT